eukprot:TRINITY_DN1146_c0_g1_i2.p1 TRINITY_DN1146_c0_g1~~TRINITY_DN1146_c0_g1_i2.p1  ORF type:complete len:4271 (-),score=1642.72 TRINITY_DN1146_c0_g1_i2:54-12866(-)
MESWAINSSELESTKDEDFNWVSLTEESILYNEAFVCSKYNELDDEKELTESDDESEWESTPDKASHKELETANKLIGLVEVEEASFKKNAIQQWTKELLEACYSPRDSSTSFACLFRKRLEVQQRLHKAYVREKERSKRQKVSAVADSATSNTEGIQSNVPVVVRLGVLTLFPLIESLSNVKDSNYSKLCRQILEILSSVLSTLPPLALHQEPSDCLDAYQNFIHSLVKGNDFVIDSEERAQAVAALVGLAVSRGNAKDLLLVANLLFQIFQKSNANTSVSGSLKLKIGKYIKQLAAHKRDQDLSVLYDRGFVDSWKINQPQLDAASSQQFSRSDAIASDGKFIYIHSFSKGLRKVGTGFGGTIQGHIYATNATYRKSDKLKSLALVGSKLYYLLPQSQPAAQPIAGQPSASSIELSLSNAYSALLSSIMETEEKEEDEDEDDEEEEEENGDKEDKNDKEVAEKAEEHADEGEDSRIQVAVIDAETLKEEKVVTLKEEVTHRSYLTSDGQYLYLLTRRKPKKEADSDAEVKIVVETFDPAEMTPISSVELGPVGTGGAPAKDGAKELPVPAVYWDRSSFYTTGYQLCVFLPVDTAATYSKIRVFNQQDGKFIKDAKIKSQPSTLTSCYDCVRNMIWISDDNTFEAWKNLGLSPKHASPLPTPPSDAFPAFSPEAILSQADFAVNEELSPLQGILIILANMDRLARQHPLYGERINPDQTSENVPSANEYIFCVESSDALFKTIHSIFAQALNSKLPEETQSYILLACLRVLKINIYELVRSGKLQRDASDPSTLLEIRGLLERFIENPQAGSASVAGIIQDEAVNVLALGLSTFYRSTPDLTSMIMTSLDNVSALTTGKKKLLEAVFSQLAEWKDVSGVLLESNPAVSEAQKRASNSRQSSTAMEVDTAEDTRMTDVEVAKTGATSRLLQALVQFVYGEAIAAITAENQQIAAAAPLISPALRLLLVLQRDVVSDAAYGHLLFDYTSAILDKAQLVLQNVLDRRAKNEANLPNSEYAERSLKSSMVGVLLQPLSLALCRREFIADPQFAAGVLPHWIRIVDALDRLNKAIPEVSEADKRYVRRMTDRRERKTFIETKHPYPQGKNQLKQTVIFAGAKALSLHFDPNSRTCSSSSDVLQLFKTPSMSEPLVNPKDGKPYVFAGNNFPKQSVLVQGDSVTFVFSANTRLDSKNPESVRQRYGFKCKVTELSLPEGPDNLLNHWLLDLENLLAVASAKYASVLIEGETPSDVEKRCQPWLEAKLLNGGLQALSEESPENLAFLEQFIAGQGDALVLYQWMTKQIGRRNLSAVAKPPLETAERYVLAVMLKHLSMVEDAREFAAALKTSESSMIADALQKDRFALISQEAAKITLVNQQKGQAENFWRAISKEKPSFEAFQSSWREVTKEKLIEMCEIKGVEYEARDEASTVKKLFDRMQEETAKKQSQPQDHSAPEPNSYEVMALPVIERAKLLLRMRPKKIVEHPTADSPNPFAVHRDRPANAGGSQKLPGSPLLRSSSHHAPTETSVTKEYHRARAEQKNNAFNRRVKELRKWLQAFKSFKRWQEGGLKRQAKPPTSPLSAVSFFVQSSLITQDLEQILKIHESRARRRVEGINYYNQLLSLVSFHSSRHQVLGSLGQPLCNGGHYLDFISTCGPELTQRVSEAFGHLFEQMLTILREKNTDTASCLLALAITGLSYQDFDVELLRNARIFSLLQQVISECNRDIETMLSKKTEEKVTPKEKKPEDENHKEPAISKEERAREEKEELERVKRLRISAWTSFRLLATRCVNWGIESDDLAESDALRELQEQIFELMCSELKSMSQKISDEDADQSFELLSLLCLLGDSAKGYKSLSREENLMNLISILKTDIAEPRAKRLALRLCRKLLPSQSKESIPKLIDFFLFEVGKSLLPEKDHHHAKSSERAAGPHKLVSLGEATEIGKRDSTAMDFDDDADIEDAAGEGEDSEDPENNEDDEEDEEDDDFEGDEDQYSVYVHTWALGYQRLIEVCQASLGQDFFGGTGGFLEKHAVDAKVQQIIHEIAEEGKALIKTTNLANANLLATAIAVIGGTVSVVEAQPAPFEDKGSQLNRNTRKIQRRSNPTFWESGHVVQGLASEYVCILRLLLDPKKSPAWSEDIRRSICRYLDLPTVLTGKATREQTCRALGSLCVLGGFTESLRVGGKVSVSEAENITKKGTVVEISGGAVEVIFDTDAAKIPRKVPIGRVVAVPELDLDASLFPLTNEILPSLLCLVRPDSPNNAGPASTLPAWLRTELKSRSMRVLTKLLEHGSSARLLLQAGPESVPALIKLANSSKPSSRQAALEREAIALSQRLWDRVTKPALDNDDTKVKKMSDLLPYYAHSGLAELLPTTWQVDKLAGFVFRGEDRRKLEYIGFDPSPLGRRSYISRVPPPQQPVEVLVCANAVIPPNVPEFYFEITVDQAESNSIISIGVVPEGSKNWGAGSYKYQANAKKTTFANGNRRVQNDYGSYFRSKSVVGCGWNRDDKILYFTKDGVDQGPAWSGINLGKVVPAIGLSRGVYTTVNFGQEPFKYKSVVEGETKEEREKRKKEDEERRKKEKEEEEERQRKMKEDERAANVLAAQPLVAMGFTLKMALVAMRQTGFSGPDAASIWLVENMNSYNFDDEEDGDEDEKKEEKEAETPAKEETKEEVKEEPKVEVNEAKEMEIEKPQSLPEEQYASSTSQAFQLGDSFTYTNDTAKKDKETSKAASEWEDQVIPAIKTFMEKDGFSPFEVEEYLQQIRTQLSSGNEQQARNIILQIVGDAGCNIQFPSSTAANRGEKPSVKTEDLKTGTWVQVSKLVPPDAKHWVSPMDKTLGRTGLVKAVDHTASLALVQFYDPESAELNEWWYSTKLLEKPDKFVPPQFLDLPEDALQAKISEVETELAGIYARKSVLSLLRHTNVTLQDGPLPLKDVLNVAAPLDVRTPLFVFPGEVSERSNDATYFRTLKQRLLELYDSQSGKAVDLTDILAKEITKLVGAASALEVSATVTVASSKPPATTENVKVDGARSLVVLFDRTGTFLPSNSQASLSLYADEGCTQLIRSYGEKSKYSPAVISSNQFYVRLECQSQVHRNNCKYKFTVVPVHADLALAFWLFRFVLKNSLRKYVSDITALCTTLFNAAVDFVYRTKAPTILKQSAFYMIAELIAVWKDRAPQEARRLPLERLAKLKDEMVALYDFEKKKENSLHSAYLQSLIELMVAVREAGGIEGLPADDPMDVEKAKEKPKAAPEKNIAKDDKNADVLNLAIALAHTLKEAESGASAATTAANEDDELASAIAMSQATESKPADDQKSEKSASSADSSMVDTSLFEDDDMDEEMKVALALSMQTSPAPETPKPTPTENKPMPPPEPPKPSAMLPPSGSSEPSTPLNASGRRMRRSQTGEVPVKDPANATAAKVSLLPWFDKIVEVKRSLKAISASDSPPNKLTLREMVKKAWTATQKDSIRERILLVDNLPLLDLDKREEIENVLRRSFGEFAQLEGDIYMPDENGKQTRGYAFVRVAGPQKVDTAVRKMHKHKLKAPTLIEETGAPPPPQNLKSSLRASASLPRGTIKVTRFVDLEKTEDARATDFLQSKLVSGKALTPKCHAALVEIFNFFGGEKENALVASQLNDLQMRSNGKPLTDEQINFAFAHYKTKPVGEKNEPALTLEGYLDLYTRQCLESPLDTWEELTKLGYDLDLNRTRYTLFDEAWDSQSAFLDDNVDAELMTYVENLYTEMDTSSPVYLAVDQLKPFTDAASQAQYRRLSKVLLPAIRLRFEVLRQFNLSLQSVLPLVNFDRTHEGSIAYLLSSCRGKIFHASKMEFVYDVLDKTSVQGNQPTVNIDRLKLAAKKDKEAASSALTPEGAVHHTMFGIAFQQLRSLDPTNLRQKKPGGAEPHFSLRINFKGENVQGEGGPYRQFFTDVSHELQSGVLPLFIPCPNSQQGLGENRDKWIPNPSADSPAQISMFEFLGRLMGLAVRTGTLLNLDLPAIFWKQVVGIAPDLKDLKQIDQSVYKALKYLAKCTKEEIETECPDETFTTHRSDGTRVALKEGGESIKVTFENRDEYVKLIEKTRLNESALQIAAIRRGVADIIPLQLLNLCTYQDLEWKVCGRLHIDINLLKRHTTCSGVSPDAPHINYFWQTLQDFNQQDRRGFLRFAWAQERLPVNDEEFERTKTRMMIKPFSGLSDPNSAFPKADTCFFNIMLPEYTSQRILRDRLLFAVYTDSHSMNADEPQEDELTTVNGNGRRVPPSNVFDYSSESDSDE